MAGRPDQGQSAKIEYDFSTGREWDQGYYLLAFHPRNYITACKSCNTPLKSNYFPIAGEQRGPQSDNPAHLASEQPFLIYPLGSLDDDPEEVLTFDGIVPKPAKQSGHRLVGRWSLSTSSSSTLARNCYADEPRRSAS